MSETSEKRVEPVLFELVVPNTPEEALEVLKVITGLGMYIGSDVPEEIEFLENSSMTVRKVDEVN